MTDPGNPFAQLNGSSDSLGGMASYRPYHPYRAQDGDAEALEERLSTPRSDFHLPSPILPYSSGPEKSPGPVASSSQHADAVEAAVPRSLLHLHYLNP
jgi:hypothetical protein